MSTVLPPGMTEERFTKALRSLSAAIGADAVLQADEDLVPYHDAYGFSVTIDHQPAAAVSPENVEQLQAVLRLANEHRLPLWPVSRGKNFGYGSAAPRMSGTVVLDLGRMRRILDIDVARGVALLEPGVGFFDLYEHLEKEKIPLWASVPGNSLGSAIGNALEYGLGYGPLGDRADSLVGMEVMLPNGELIRTGMGAMQGSKCWNLFRYSYGPSWDQLFMQSNFGVVTKAGVWLYPEPEEVLSLSLELPNETDIGWVVETLAPLRMRNVVQGPINIGNFMRIVMGSGRRAEFSSDKRAIPDAMHPQIMKAFGLGLVGAASDVLRRAGAQPRAGQGCSGRLRSPDFAAVHHPGLASGRTPAGLADARRADQLSAAHCELAVAQWWAPGFLARAATRESRDRRADRALAGDVSPARLRLLRRCDAGRSPCKRGQHARLRSGRPRHGAARGRAVSRTGSRCAPARLWRIPQPPQLYG